MFAGQKGNAVRLHGKTKMDMIHSWKSITGDRKPVGPGSAPYILNEREYICCCIHFHFICPPLQRKPLLMICAYLVYIPTPLTESFILLCRYRCTEENLVILPPFSFIVCILDFGQQLLYLFIYLFVRVL